MPVKEGVVMDMEIPAEKATKRRTITDEFLPHLVKLSFKLY